MADPRFLDANVLLRFYTGASDPLPENQRKAERARAVLERVEQGLEKVIVSHLVLFEVIFSLDRVYKVPKATIQRTIQALLALPGLQLTNKRFILQALDLYVQQNVSFVDAYLVGDMQQHGVGSVYSWDTDFDKFPAIAQVAP